jgi:hypothetical protein
MNERWMYASTVNRLLCVAPLLASSFLGGGCDRPSELVSRPAAARSTASAAADVMPAAPERIPAPERVIAIGDVHGDLQASRRALRMAGAIDGEDNWVGGKLVVVQTGDQLDRGDDEPEVLALFDALATKAAAAGGRVISLNGNHEVMNVQGDFRYVTEDGLRDYAAHASTARAPALLERVAPAARGRAAAFLPGGPAAQKLADRALVAIVADSVFVHGGILPAHVRYGLARANEESARWMRGGAGRMPAILEGDDSPVWTRAYGDPEPRPDACTALGKVLEALSVKRMVVGHTTQKNGITSACAERVWRIDVGLGKSYGGRTGVLEIRADRVRAITAEPP